jgi:hypothetical protein
MRKREPAIPDSPAPTRNPDHTLASIRARARWELAPMTVNPSRAIFGALISTPAQNSRTIRMRTSYPVAAIARVE